MYGFGEPILIPVTGLTISSTFFALGVIPFGLAVLLNSSLVADVGRLLGEEVTAGCDVGDTVGLKLVVVYGLNLWWV